LRLCRAAARGLALALALAAGPLAAQLEEPATEPAGPEVVAIEIRSDTSLDRFEDLESLIVVEVGKPLTDEAIRRTLRNLQATGAAAEIELYTQEEPGGGVVAVIVFRPVVQVEAIRIEGNLGLRSELLRGAVPQGEAEPLVEDRVVQGVFNLLDLYEERGYFQATARVNVEIDAERAVVTYTVDSGPRATVGPIVFEGNLGPFSPATLLRQIRTQPNSAYRAQVARFDAERLQDWLIRQRHGAAEVERPRMEYEPATNTIRITFHVEVGPKIVLQVIGADEKTLRRKGLLPFLGEAGYDEALVVQAVNRIKTYYQEQGYYRVRIDTEEQTVDGVLNLVFRIDPGAEYTLEEIDLVANREISDEELAARMTTSRRSLLRRGSGRLVQEVLDDDIENLRRYYALQGYPRAEVGPPVIEETGTGGLRLLIPIQEGPRLRVVNLFFEGIEKLDLSDLRERLPLREGGPFHPALLDNALNTIRLTYAGEGYAEAQVSAREDWNPEHTLVDLTIQVLEGPLRVVDRIIVRGNRRTESDVIRRTLGLRTGEPISDTRLLEIERNLYRLGIFSDVEVELARGGLGAAERDVLVRVQEGRPRSLTYGVGWDSEDGLRGLVGYSHNNVAGKAYSLRTDLRLSQGNNNRFRLIFNQPYLAEHSVALTETVFYEEVAERDRDFEVTRYGARVEAVRAFESRRVSLGLDYRTVELTVDPGVASNDIEREDQPYQLTSLVPSFFWDRRNDPLIPVRGWSSLVQLQYAFPALSTEVKFLKLFAQQTQYLDLGPPGVLAASLRFGGIEPYSTLSTDPEDPLAGLPSRNVPIAERFFAGGDATHRAFGRDELGIPGETLIERPDGGFSTAGGNGLFLFNLEYRFPIAGAFGGTLFYDTGNVWADWRSIDLSELRNGAGLGVRYLSPIGPIRAGIGWKLDREQGEPAYEWFFNIGNPF